jgi:hypothetical protein
MAKKPQSGDVNKSSAIRDLLAQNPKASASEVITSLAGKGIEVAPSLFYFVKGKMSGRRGRRRKMRRQVASVMSTNSVAATSGDVVATIKKVKGLAGEVGGLRKLLALVEALGD